MIELDGATVLLQWAAGGWLMGPLELRDLEEESGAVHNSNFTALLRHRRGACSTAWRCGSLTARLGQHGRVVAEK